MLRQVNTSQGQTGNNEDVRYRVMDDLITHSLVLCTAVIGLHLAQTHLNVKLTLTAMSRRPEDAYIESRRAEKCE